MAEIFDFSGWATRHNLRCSDGRTIRNGAFKDQDGDIVPLIYAHNHNDPAAVIGHALLENRDEGVYAYCALNDSDGARAAREAVKHGDLDSLSIYANNLQQSGGDVLHGCIRELSLVLHGANPGAFIDNVVQHGDQMIYNNEGWIYNGEMIDHETLYERVPILEHEDKEDDSERTIKDVFDEMTEEQKAVVYFMAGEAEKKAKEDMKSEAKHSGIEGDDTMKRNVFDQSVNATDPAIQHGMSEMVAHKSDIFKDAKKLGSMKEAVLSHAEEYGIKDINWLFPEDKNVNVPPEWIKRDDSWVAAFIGAVKKVPFSRIKTMFADVTEDEARAKGYTKGKKKIEEVFKLLKRSTEPTTIYKKQKLDRDDVIDITDFDVVAWMKQEMDFMLDEELARAILIGDGRSAVAEDKIAEDHIRPIWKDDDLYTIKAQIEPKADATEDDRARAFIRQAVKARRNFKGTGTPTLYTTEEMLSDMLLLEDATGRRLYDDVNKLATAMRVRAIVTVEVMENQTREQTGTNYDLAGIIVNPADYVLGATRGGEKNFFDDFDIDYNQMIYLLETRRSGALVKPHSAIAIEFKQNP